MIDLTDSHLLGMGNERKCYVHPDDDSVCIKINRSKSYVNDTPEQSLVEYDYYSYLERRGVPLTHLPGCFGWIETNKGTGLAFERIRATEDGVSLTLDKALEQGALSKSEAKALISDVYRYLFRYRLMLSDLSPDNFGLRFEPEPRLYLIDGLGSRNMDKKYFMRKRWPTLAWIKTWRQWRKYHHRLLTEVSQDVGR